MESTAWDPGPPPRPSTETCLPVRDSPLLKTTRAPLPSLRRVPRRALFPQREQPAAASPGILTQVRWFVRRSGTGQQAVQLLPLQGAVQGLLFAEGGEGPLGRRLRLRRLEHLGVWNRVHARDVQVAAVVGGLASIRRDERRHPAPVRVAQGFAFLGAVGEEVHAWGRRKRDCRGSALKDCGQRP